MAKYDGKYVLLTNTNLAPKETALAYKELWRVERAFCTVLPCSTVTIATSPLAP